MYLVLECSTPNASLAIGNESKQLELNWVRQKMYGEPLLENVREILEQASVNVKDLRGILVSGGPGSFTGIRVSVSVARTFAYSLEVPVALYDSLQAVAITRSSRSGRNNGVIMNAYGNSVFFGAYNFQSGRWGVIHPPCHGTIENLELDRRFLKSPSTLEFLGDTTPAGEADVDVRPQVSAMAVLKSCLDGSLVLDWNRWDKVSPLYIKLSGAEEKLR